MQLKIDIYGATINVDILESVDDCQNYIVELNKNYNKDYEIIKFEGCVFYTINRTYNLVLVKEFINANLLFHEIYHIVSNIADSCDLDDEENREARAYLQGYIGEQIINLLISNRFLIL